jgi:hypothetical protein
MKKLRWPLVLRCHVCGCKLLDNNNSNSIWINKGRGPECLKHDLLNKKKENLYD